MIRIDDVHKSYGKHVALQRLAGARRELRPTMRDHMLEELEAKVADGVGVFGRAEPARHQDTQRVAVFDLLAERVRRAAPRLRFARVVQNLECLYRLLHLQLSQTCL